MIKHRPIEIKEGVIYKFVSATDGEVLYAKANFRAGYIHFGNGFYNATFSGINSSWDIYEVSELEKALL